MSEEIKDKWTTIAIRKSTMYRLNEVAHGHESYDTVINRLLERRGRPKKVEEKEVEEITEKEAVKEGEAKIIEKEVAKEVEVVENKGINAERVEEMIKYKGELLENE